jgi:predicted hotdog family 3-hydroxylacyl-ACP dehydratase
MCLLARVQSWDAQRISCISTSHRDADNPLRAGGMLPALCGIEYAAQAMAVHGGLSAALDGRPKAGYLVSLRNVQCRRARLDDLAGELTVSAERVMGDAARVIYEFALHAGDEPLLSGRATVVLDVQMPQTSG